jgi:hypothetical protein
MDLPYPKQQDLKDNEISGVFHILVQLQKNGISMLPWDQFNHFLLDAYLIHKIIQSSKTIPIIG